MIKALSLIVATLYCSSLCAQTVVPLDYPANFPKEKKIKANYLDTIVIRVTNLNRKIYKVESSDTHTDFNITVPSALKSIKLPGFLVISPPDDGTEGLFLPGDSIASIARIQQLFWDIERRGRKLNAATFLYNGLMASFKDCNLTAADILDTLKDKTYWYLELAGTPASISHTTLEQRLKDTLQSLITQALVSYDELQRTVPNFITEEKERNAEQIRENEKLRKQAEIEARNSSGTRQNNARNAANNHAQRIQQLINYQLEIAKVEAKLNEQLKKAEEVIDLMEEFDKEDKRNTIVSLYRIMNNPRNYMFESEPIVLKKDETRYKITVSPEELNACGSLDKKTSEIVISTRGGVKVDFSSGVFLLGGNGTFLGETYYWENIDATSRRIVTADRGARMQLGVGALIHFYIRNHKVLKPALSLGVSTTANFDDLNFHAGPSLIFGNKDRFIISGGLALKSSKVLDRKLEVNTIYAKGDTPDEIPTVSQFPKSGWFIGLTYNISRFKSE